MADGSHADPQQTKESTFSVRYQTNSDTKKCSDTGGDNNRVKLLFYVERETSEACEKSDSRGVAGGGSGAFGPTLPRKYSALGDEHGDDRKKRCFDRYDSSESSDSGVVVLSPPESSGSGSDIASPGSPLSPQPAGEEAPRMPPWAPEPASAGQRRTSSARDRRITEYYNHKMKPNTLKRDNVCSNTTEDTKRKCLSKNGVTQDLEKYISYLSQTLSPRVLLDMDKQTLNARKNANSTCNGIVNEKQKTASQNVTNKPTTNGFIQYNNKSNKNRVSSTVLNGSVDGLKQHGIETKEKVANGSLHRTCIKKQTNPNSKKLTVDPSANGISKFNNKSKECLNKKVPKTSRELMEVRIAPALPVHKEACKEKCSKINGVVSSTTCGSNNLSLVNSKSPKKESPRKTNTATARRNNRRSSACIANSKNLTWSKANNLKQQVQQLQKQNCVNSVTNSPINNMTNDLNSAANGLRPVPLLNGNLGNINVPVSSLSNCHQINIPVSSTNLASFVAMPQNVMLTTLRIPQNGITAQTVNQHNNLNAFNRPNVGVSSPTKLNGQFVFPLVQNLNGMMQIPNLMAKVAPNFVLPHQTSQLATQRAENLQAQQPQILINGTLLKLAPNNIPANFTNLTKPVPSNVTIPAMNKTVAPGIPSVGMTVQSKSNFTVNISHPLLMPQPGFIVNSVPNINVKETWSGITPTSTQNSTCANPLVNHPPPTSTQSNENLHSSSIPIAPVKPPDLPDQGLDPPYTVKEDAIIREYKNTKCDIPWLSKTVNNNHLDSSKLPSRPFAEICNLSEKLSEFKSSSVELKQVTESIKISTIEEQSNDEIRRVKEVARREETIFTQITVLTDVTSSVKNAVIEANYSNATNESSESGIGTDKSIDSPSDSQTSKECDEDSALSLSVSVCSVETRECQKSPILKQPTKLRFPPKSLVKADSEPRSSGPEPPGTVTVCLWENCKSELENDSDLLEHIQAAHVEPQAGRENFVCLWEQCKVRGKPSCSRLWLERHAMSHGGNKPFKCIVQGCGKRFSTQILLERHVNNHFNEQSPNSVNPKKSADSASKLIRRNGKKLRYRRQPWSARMFDFFDAGIMEGIAYRLIRGTRWRLGGRCPLQEPLIAPTLVLRACIRAARYDHIAATTEALVTYYPPHVLEDEWLPEKDVQRIKIVEIARLPVHAKVSLYEQFCSSYKSPPITPKITPISPKTSNTPPVFNTPRVLPVRTCTSSRLLNKLINKQKEMKNTKVECRGPPLFIKEYEKVEISGAAKRKMGRKYGGNAFWPCGR